jgi:hypothetical protein
VFQSRFVTTRNCVVVIVAENIRLIFFPNVCFTTIVYTSWKLRTPSLIVNPPKKRQSHIPVAKLGSVSSWAWESPSHWLIEEESKDDTDGDEESWDYYFSTALSV